MKPKNLLWGIFFIGAAVLLVVNQLGYFTGLNLWSLLVTIMVVPVIGSGLRRRNFFNIFFGIAILLIVFAKPLNITALVPWTVLAAAFFLSIGFTIIFRPGSIRHHRIWNEESWEKHRQCHKNDDYETVDHVEGNEVDCHVSMGGTCKYLHSDALKNGRFECSMGYLKAYFDNVKLSPDGATIVVDCFLGSMDLFIPRDWNVVLNVDSMLGNIDEHGHIQTLDGPSLTITGNIRLANLSIRYV